LAACRSAPPPAPLLPPPLACDVIHFPGTVLSGPRPDPHPAETATVQTALVLDCAATWLADPPLGGLTPIASSARLIVGSRNSQLLWPAADLDVTDVRIAEGAAAEEFCAALAEQRSDGVISLFAGRGVVPPGVTARFAAASSGAAEGSAGVQVGREVDGSLSVAVVLQRESSVSVVPDKEIALLGAAPPVGGPPLVVVVPSFFDPGALVLRIALREPEPGDAEQDAAFARCLAQLQRAQAHTESAAAVLDPASARALAIAAVLHDLGSTSAPRSLLLHLAEDGSLAPLALDLGLSGADDAIARWTTRIIAAVEAAGGAERVARDREGLAWILERTAYEMLAEGLERDDLPVEQLGMLARHAGEAGCFPGTLDEVLASVRNRAELEERLFAENDDFLEAAEPGARVRAFDWLAARGRAPEGFDPLAPREERRRALARRAEREGESRP
jgi:hypothetical protein